MNAYSEEVLATQPVRCYESCATDLIHSLALSLHNLNLGSLTRVMMLVGVESFSPLSFPVRPRQIMERVKLPGITSFDVLLFDERIYYTLTFHKDINNLVNRCFIAET